MKLIYIPQWIAKIVDTGITWTTYKICSCRSLEWSEGATWPYCHRRTNFASQTNFSKYSWYKHKNCKIVAEAWNDLRGHFTYSGTSSFGFEGKSFRVSAFQPLLCHIEGLALLSLRLDADLLVLFDPIFCKIAPTDSTPDQIVTCLGY